MGGIVSKIVWNVSGFVEEPVKILLFGLRDAGKTTTLYGLKLGYSEKLAISPTPGFNVETVACDGFKIKFWDVGIKCRPLWAPYFPGSAAVIFVVDSSDRWASL